jgi:cellulose biosynthesis protein BcsQ
MIISLYNIKGGVGKTSTCINLSFIASKRGKTLLIDLDPQGASSYFYEKRPKKRNILKKDLSKIIKHTRLPNLDIIPADTKLENYKGDIEKILENLKKEYDFIFIDAPASLSPLTRDILKYSDIVIVPVMPNILSLRTYNQIVDMNIAKNVKLLLNGVENKPAHKKIVKTILTLPKAQYLRTYIPRSDMIENMPFYRSSVISKYPQSNITKAYYKLFNELI